MTHACCGPANRGIRTRLCKSARMALTPDDIIEEIIDELAMGELGESVEAFEFSRTGPGSLLLDYGALGRFRLSVVADT